MKYNGAASGWVTPMSQEHLMMPDPAFLVDGVVEQKILGQICRDKPIRRLNYNGLDVR
jgi:hypothetical protein